MTKLTPETRTFEGFITKQKLCEAIGQLYEEFNVNPTNLDDLGERKSIRFADNSWIFMDKSKNGMFLVNMNGGMYYQLSSEGVPSSSDYIHINTPYTLSIGGFTQEQEMDIGSYIKIPEKHKETVYTSLIDWTRISIAQGKIAEPPYKLEFVGHVNNL
ncbi:MAG: hypothetical protein HW400_713 [Candidatus Levybacteria bacterium]|nr:hypothetical protein [Candidatus Levybacteria bacterium]